MEKWIEIKKSGDFREWGRQLGIDPLCARIIRNRGIDSVEEAEDYLNGDLGLLHDPFLLPDMEKAVDALIDAVKTGEKIRIIGDYDVDGVTSTVILVKCIRAAGGDVSYSIPDRLRDGYGINDDLVRKASDEGIKLIITCDNGIAAASQVRLAYELGMKVIVTDHHQVPYFGEGDEKNEILPECEAVVDPHRNGSVYPYKGICGAMVAYKFMSALLRRMGGDELDDALEESVQFAALGTVCDVMELTGENRYLVREGIKRIKNTRNPGLRALMSANSLEASRISTYSLSFVIGPSINSTGRLEQAGNSVSLLLSDDYDECLREAAHIKDLNDHRKNMTVTGLERAVKLIEDGNMLEDRILVVYLPDVHESIAGLVAGKIKENYNRPTLVITKGEDGLKGSGRSIPAYNMFEKLSEVKELFTKFGGHAMAAGFSLEEKNLDELTHRLKESSGLTDDDLVREVRYDACIPLEYPSVRLVKDMAKLEPLGVGNPGPLFASLGVRITGISRMGKEGKYGNLTAVSGGKRFRLIYFGDMDVFEGYIDEKFGPKTALELCAGKTQIDLDICFESGLNEFRGNESVDFKMKNYR
ncbi:MAG: single-stranded-DNA-specific exonuclease RecJ [Lachnospiraceae bacterium]|nr:single-stranded-DNA-specific exonuclease RecJ [Lachnospiraceae bacterium]